MSFAEDVEMKQRYVVNIALRPDHDLHNPQDIEQQDATDRGVDVDGRIIPEVRVAADQQ
jgi:hypothetical protein